MGDAGPAFVPGAEPPPAPAPIDPATLAGGPQWNAGRVRSVLQAQGELLHNAVAVDPDSTEWRYTSADLDAIAGPLSRILNRYDVTRAGAAAGDELAVGIGFMGYGMRSWSERRRAIAELGDVEPEPEPYQPPPAAAPAPAPEPAAAAPVFPEPDETPPIAPTRR